MKKKLIVAGVALTALFGLTGCMENGQTLTKDSDGGYNVVEFNYVHSDGTKMPCIKFDRGITCDWSKNPKH